MLYERPGVRVNERDYIWGLSRLVDDIFRRVSNATDSSHRNDDHIYIYIAVIRTRVIYPLSDVH